MGTHDEAAPVAGAPAPAGAATPVGEDLPVGTVWFIGKDGQRVSARHFGGAGPLLVIAHAAGFCGGAYAPMAAELVASFEVWAIDLRGHGDSPAPADGDFCWEGMAHDVLTVVRGLDRGPAVFFGHSLGGAAGMRAEALVPGTFTAIYVYEPAVPPPIDGVAEACAAMGKLARQRRAVFGSREEAVARLGARPPYDAMCADALEAYVAYGTRKGSGPEVTLKCDPDSEARVYEAPVKITVAQVSQITVPVLIGMGQAEPGLPAAAVPLIAAALPDARTEPYPELGHLGPFENPKLIAAHVASHLLAARRADNVPLRWSTGP